MALENNINVFKAQQIVLVRASPNIIFFLMFPTKIYSKNQSAPVTVSMVAKWPPLSG